MIRERVRSTLPGWVMLPVLMVLSILSIVVLITMARGDWSPAGWGVLALLIVSSISMCGLFVVYPNDAKVVLLFGDYIGSVRKPGFHWVNPLTLRRRVSLKIRNFESAKLKVNDLDGNPIEIAAVVVWRVVETAEAMFEVDDYQHFVHVQSEAALRNLTTSYSYDSHHDGALSLRANTAAIAEQLKKEIQERLEKAGVEVMESRISHLAYAPEIASAMLRRQQASAVVAARTKIVEGAVGMVELALAELASRQIIELDGERKAAMVSNLLVVLCGDRDPQPIVNTGTLYQ
jgi:regulator of protease activity HflC (stomatin/prohibitin superfamily)